MLNGFKYLLLPETMPALHQTDERQSHVDLDAISGETFEYNFLNLDGDRCLGRMCDL
jgi:hypothetical protein